MKQFIIGHHRDITRFSYVGQNTPGISKEKIKPSIFHGIQIRQLVNNLNIVESMNGEDLKAWMSFVLVIKNFLDVNYVKIINKIIDNLTDLGCNMSRNANYLHSNLDSFPENLGNNSKEQGIQVDTIFHAN